MTTAGIDATLVRLVIRPTSSSLRSVRMADLVAEEIGERFSCRSGQNEGLPARVQLEDQCVEPDLKKGGRNG